MKLKFDYNGKSEIVEVIDESCIKRDCFMIHKKSRIYKNENGIFDIKTDEYYSCAFRNYFGCMSLR